MLCFYLLAFKFEIINSVLHFVRGKLVWHSTMVSSVCQWLLEVCPGLLSEQGWWQQSYCRANGHRKLTSTDLPYFSPILSGTVLQSDPALSWYRLLWSASYYRQSHHLHFSLHVAMLLSYSDSMP